MPRANRNGKNEDEQSYAGREPAQRYRDDPVFDDPEPLLMQDALENGTQDDPDGVDEEMGRRHAPSWAERLEKRVPASVQRVSEVVVNWVKGPDPPRIYKIEPIFPSIQHAPLQLLDKYAPKEGKRFWLLIALYAGWMLSFSFVLWKSSFASDVKDFGAPVRLSCTARYWSDLNGCGLNGDQCRPFGNSTLAFRCPSSCIGAQVYNPHAVGDQDIVYQPLIIGGSINVSEPLSSSVYRGDSFICGSAVHAGFISDSEGGCGALKLIGEHDSFPGTDSHGIKSIGFDSYFPHSFSFLDGTQTQCKDLRWPSLIVTVLFTTALSIFTTSPGVFFWSMFVALFFQTGLASDPPNLTDYYSLISIALGRFLPAAFCGAVLYRTTIHYTLDGLTAQFEKTVLWLGAAWVGALNNYTFDRIPIQRLTPHDLKAQPGAIPALIAIILIIFSIALGQAWSFRVEGRMPKYLLVYGVFGLGLLFFLAVPGMSLRIHHYILALLFLPGTAFQNRQSLLYQGLLMGLFINGIARWGFDSILQTPGELLGDAQLGTLLPMIAAPIIGALNNNITFTLGPIHEPYKERKYDGVSILVNDVERLRTYEDYDDSGAWVDGQREWTWNRHEEGLPEYFRFAYMMGSQTADFTKAGKWTADGQWIPMASGPSK